MVAVCCAASVRSSAEAESATRVNLLVGSSTRPSPSPDVIGSGRVRLTEAAAQQSPPGTPMVPSIETPRVCDVFGHLGEAAQTIQSRNHARAPTAGFSDHLSD